MAHVAELRQCGLRTGLLNSASTPFICDFCALRRSGNLVAKSARDSLCKMPHVQFTAVVRLASMQAKPKRGILSYRHTRRCLFLEH